MRLWVNADVRHTVTIIQNKNRWRPARKAESRGAVGRVVDLIHLRSLMPRHHSFELVARVQTLRPVDSLLFQETHQTFGHGLSEGFPR